MSLPRKMSSPHKSAFHEPDYMVMAGSAASVNDNDVFCAVELPQRHGDPDSTQAEYLNIPSRPRADSSDNYINIPGRARTNSGESRTSCSAAEEEGYLDMSLGQSPKKQEKPANPAMSHAQTEPAYLDMNQVSRESPTEISEQLSCDWTESAQTTALEEHG